MSLSLILFEDHSAQGFRPLSWSVPVYELPSGLFHLRERLELLAADHPVARRVLLPRGFLQELQDRALPTGWTSGFEAARQAAALGERVLLISSRWSGRGASLLDLLQAASRDFVSRDQDGLVAAACDAATAATLLESWNQWDQTCTRTQAWTLPTTPVPTWLPEIDGVEFEPLSWRRLWDRIPGIGEAVVEDLRLVIDAGRPYSRSVFGVTDTGDAPGTWRRPIRLAQLTDVPAGVSILGEHGVWIGEDSLLDPSVVLDAREGPIVLESDVTIRSHVLLVGPLAVGIGSTVKAGARIGGETAIGPVCRINGEVAESQILAFANKQHAGFLGHAVLGSWVNLGADTTNSDLKNNYGLIQVNAGLGPEPTGTRFLGLMMAEHGKSAIGTTFNTATTVGFSANVFAAGFPRACIGNFSWGDGRGKITDVERAIETARIVMSRRGVELTPAHEDLFRRLASGLQRPAL